MSEHNSDPKIDATGSADTETALPLVEAPAISPAAAEVASAVEASPIKAAPVQASAAETPVTQPNATQRFRAAAATQIAAARQRLEQRNTSSVMAVALIASLGASGTIVATNAIAHFSAPVDQRVARSLDDSIARLDDAIAALLGKVERATELSAAQAAEAGERLERIEKAQAEPVAKLGKLVEMVEKLRLVNVAQAHEPSANAAANDVTGSIKPAPGAKASAKAAIVEGWTLLEVDRDAALLEGKRGLFETSVGDMIPGVGRVEGFRKQDGRWVVVTAKGLIVSR